MKNWTPEGRQRGDRFHKYLVRFGIHEEQLFFHPVDEDLSPGTPDLTEKLRPAFFDGYQCL